MKGWMKYRHKGGIYGRLSGLRSDYHLFFVLIECQLIGYKDENTAEHMKEDTSVIFDIHNTAISTNPDHTNLFEVIGQDADEALNWISSLQLQRSLQQGTSPAPNHMSRKSKINQHVNEAAYQSFGLKKENCKSDSDNLNDQLVFDDPLSAVAPRMPVMDGAEFEWDNETPSALSSPNSNLEGSSVVFQLTDELSKVRKELDDCRQRIQSYKEVLASRDRQLFEIRDEMSSQSSISTHSEEFRNLQQQARSYRDQNAVLNEEVLKLNQMFHKANTEATNEKRKIALKASETKRSRQNWHLNKKRADKLTAELSRFQRDYLSALSSCVHRPLVDPDDGASFDIPEKQHHIATLKSLANLMKSKNDRILGCAIPKLGKSEHHDAFGFINTLPNEALQVEYLCHHLHEAYSILMETDEENQKNLKKWKKCIMDSSEEFEISPSLRKLVLQGVPSQYRAYLWQKLIYYYVADMRKTRGDGYYETLSSQKEVKGDDKNFAKYLKQISMDVPRTMPNNKDYSVPDSEQKEKLQHVLSAFCIHCPKVGYCQGFNFLVGGCLLFLEEEDAFWFLVAVVEKIFPPNYYRNGLAGLLADQYALQDIISQYLPKLAEHLSRFPEVDLAAVTTGWFLGLFFDCLPFQTLIRVWDCFLSFGHEAVFRIAFAMFKIFESRLLKLNELSQVLHAAKNIPKLCLSSSQLIKEAFNCDFPSWEYIEELRSQLESELIEKHDKKMAERRYYDQRMILLDEDEDYLQGQFDDKFKFNCGAGGDKCVLSASCRLSQVSHLYELESDLILPLRLPVSDRVMCVYIFTDDIILLGTFSGQLQAYSICENALKWSMSLSEVVLCILSYDGILCAGTADGKLHMLQISDKEAEVACTRKPALLDSIELSKRPTTCCCFIADKACLWAASGPAIYVVSIETCETDGFFLISSRIELVSTMLHWSKYVLISVRGSSIIQLHGTDLYNMPPLLVYDVARQMPLPLLYPMMPDGDSKSPASGRITCALLVRDDVFWIGTAGGDLIMYMMEAGDIPSSPTSPHEIEDSCDNLSKPFKLGLLRSVHASEKPIRCLFESKSRVISCAGYYGEDGSVKIWNFEGDYVLAEVPACEPSNSEVFDDAQSAASSSRSIDADSRMHKSSQSDAWKSMKSAASAMTKKPRFRRLMNMLGT